jgi:hypothetical protein
MKFQDAVARAPTSSSHAPREQTHVLDLGCTLFGWADAMPWHPRSWANATPVLDCGGWMHTAGCPDARHWQAPHQQNADVVHHTHVGSLLCHTHAAHTCAASRGGGVAPASISSHASGGAVVHARVNVAVICSRCWCTAQAKPDAHCSCVAANDSCTQGQENCPEAGATNTSRLMHSRTLGVKHTRLMFDATNAHVHESMPTRLHFRHSGFSL